MNILFVMERRVNAGSIQAVANYVRVGNDFGHTIALYGRPYASFPAVRFSTDLDAFDYVVFIVESGLGWMNGLRMPRLLAGIARDRRVIFDADGMYNEAVIIDGYDRNHDSEHARLKWFEHFNLLSDRVFQPTVEPRNAQVRPLLFYGFDPTALTKTPDATTKCFDVLHVGHNWWRWREVSRYLLPAFEQVRSRLDGIGFIGSWWDAPPSIQDRSLGVAFCVEADWFRRLNISVKPAVPYTDVISTMSKGRVNIMTQRPLFRHLKLLTSKFFEIFAADTIPLIMLDPDHAESVYGPTGRQLVLGDPVADKLLDVLHRPNEYRDIVQEVRRYLAEHHSYHNRMQELVIALRG